MSLISLAILADDLTGALDAAVPFAAGQMRVVVATRPEAAARAAASGAPVIAVALNSREGSADEAIRKTALALAGLPPGVPLFRKVDSRLKGHVGAELAATARGAGLRRVLLCPAIPAFGRGVRDGAVMGFGVDQPIDVAAAARWPDGPEVLVPDAETDAALDALLRDLPADALPAGASGLAAALARRMGCGQPRTVALPLPRPAALLIGSRDPITLAQVAALAAAAPRLARVSAPDGLPDAPAPEAALALLQATAGAGLPADQVGARLASAFAKGWVAGRSALVLTGGETAAAVLAALGADLLQIEGQALPGLPAARALDFPGAPLIVTKSGGFGTPDTLCRLLGEVGMDAGQAG